MGTSFCSFPHIYDYVHFRGVFQVFQGQFICFSVCIHVHLFVFHHNCSVIISKGREAEELLSGESSNDVDRVQSLHPCVEMVSIWEKQLPKSMECITGGEV